MPTRPSFLHQPFVTSPVVRAKEAIDDVSLARRCLDGDEGCFATLVERYEKVLFNLALRMVGDYEDARDIVQSTFVKAYEKLESFDPDYKFFSWLYRIAVNESINLVQRRKDTEPLDERLESRAPSPGEELEKQRLSERIQSALMKLTPDYRQVVILRHFLELSYREMSDLIGIPEKTVKSRLYTARRQLSEILLPGRTHP